ncbi:MAG: hypothetical protein IJO32_07005 [Bacilli bacterium]|nr:hypothetical protein [Bacilli bacterium]
MKKPYHDEENFVWNYYFDKLNEDLFKSFMTGEISIEELLKQNKEKTLKKQNQRN